MSDDAPETDMAQFRCGKAMVDFLNRCLMRQENIAT
jgi:hypothetical protein